VTLTFAASIVQAQSGIPVQLSQLTPSMSVTEGTIASVKELDITKTVVEATAQKPVHVLSEHEGNSSSLIKDI